MNNQKIPHPVIGLLNMVIGILLPTNAKEKETNVKCEVLDPKKRRSKH